MVFVKKKSVREGKFFPLGASPEREGVNFALYARYAEGVDLCLFEKPGDDIPSDVIPLVNKTRFVWHCFVEGIGPGQLYGYRVRGPYRPEEGLRYNSNRLLVDPYARAITGKFDHRWCHLGYDPGSGLKDLSYHSQDNAAGAPKCVVVDDGFNWEGDASPGVPMTETIIYEVHLKGFTAGVSSGVQHPGTYLGFIEKIPYLKSLGITSVELLPVQHGHDEDFLVDKGFTNYWGYNTLGFFAPDSRFSSGRVPGCQVVEFKEMVKAMHREGLEIILDVVYNHTCEGNELGPTLCFRGIDNPTYYKLSPDGRCYVDYTGCGNTLDFDSDQVVKLVMDSLRYWVEVMHVDGFRFDLASVLGREEGSFEKVNKFFTAVHQDPVLSRVKLIAEPWDATCDSYQVGNFPVDWAEWNGKYRDCVRKFVKGDPGMLPELRYRLSGSPDLYCDDGRTPYHSINFITCHDGFTLNDLVSYSTKHNEANLENNRDGTGENNAWNCGAEGETADPAVAALRKRQVKNFLAVLMVSQGIPMILGGDEFLRTQKGNNNAFCQDNAISYFDWSLIQANLEMLDFLKKLTGFRRRQAHFLRKEHCAREMPGSNGENVKWYDENLDSPEWQNPEKRGLAFLVEGVEIKDNPFELKDVFVILNAHWEEKCFYLPRSQSGAGWFRVLDTALSPGEDITGEEKAVAIDNQDCYQTCPRSVVLLIRKNR